MTQPSQPTILAARQVADLITARYQEGGKFNFVAKDQRDIDKKPPSELIDEDLKDAVLAEFEKEADGRMHMFTEAEEGKKDDDLQKAIENKDRDALINRILDLFFKNASPQTVKMVCGQNYAQKREDYRFWTEAASTGLAALGLLGGFIAVATLPATVAAVALVIAKYSQKEVCDVRMKQA